KSRTRAGSLENPWGEATSMTSWPSQSPSASRKVFSPLSADMPAPLRTTIRFFSIGFLFLDAWIDPWFSKVTFSKFPILCTMFDHVLLDYLEGYLTEERKNRFLEVLGQRTKFVTVALEDVYQMHNTSAITRSCD